MRNQERANTAARQALASFIDPKEPLPTRIQDLVSDLGHLCDGEDLDFIDIVERALWHWNIESSHPDDPNSVMDGPSVQIIIGDA